jgi:hypothetical protein
LRHPGVPTGMAIRGIGCFYCRRSVPGKDWLDSQRRVVRNAFGPLSDPEGEPDWSLLAK